MIVTSSDETAEIARTRALFGRTRGQLVTLLESYRSGAPADGLLLPPVDRGPLEQAAGIPVIPVGYSFPVRLSGGVVNLGLPVDITSRLEKLMLAGRFDVVHVHEPLAPSLSFTALRETRSPVVGSFHLTPVGAAAYELGQSVVDRFFLRLDARIVTFEQGRRMIEELFPSRYEVVSCGTSLEQAEPRIPRTERSERTALYVYRGDARRSYRALMRAFSAGLPSGIDRLVVALHRPSTERWLPRAVPRKLRPRVVLQEFTALDELAPFYEAADVVILPFLGGEWLCTSLAEAKASGCPVVGPDLPPLRDYLAAGGRGGWFYPGDAASLAAALHSALAPLQISTAGEETRTHAGLPPADASSVDSSSVSMSSVAERVADIYRSTIDTTSRRNGSRLRSAAATRSMHVRGIGETSVRKRVRHGAPGPMRADWINADLHIHSNFSNDSASTVQSILATAREIGLGAIAIADHNEIQGALLAKELAGGDPFVIVAEEVKTSEGEVIGLFLEGLIPKGLTFDQTLSLIKEQGGLVYVPHPFDVLRTTPSYRTLVDNLHRIDVIEIYNGKVALSSFNLSAERFAAKYNIVAGAGSDAHVLQGLGTAMLRMPRFHDQESFMAALWEADIIARRKSLLYLQSLKLLQTTLDRVLPED